ncbi:MAG: ATP-binding protein [Mangrovibacterium sp.]|nr:ATP-binding protein [Mangrovibacterium sp.]
MLIKGYLSGFYHTVDAYSGLSSIEDELLRRNFLVVFEEGQFSGILTPADVISKPRKLVIDCLTKKDRLDANETILFAWTQMCRSHSSALPVFENDVFIGIIEKENIIQGLMQKIDQLDTQSLVSQKVKSEFIHSLSHEIRTPLNGILGFVNILAEMDLDRQDKSYQEFAEMITTNADCFLVTMNDLIEISLKESGEKLSLHWETVSLEKIFGELQNLFEKKSLMQVKQLSILPMNPDPSLRILTDNEKLKHILYHLLDNAIKFAEVNSQVSFGIEKDAESLITFFVTSSGPPITAADQQKIFELFDKSGLGRLKAEGLGIGLTVAKHFVESLHGTIELITGENTNTFCFSIPKYHVN